MVGTHHLQNQGPHRNFNYIALQPRTATLPRRSPNAVPQEDGQALESEKGKFDRRLLIWYKEPPGCCCSSLAASFGPGALSKHSHFECQSFLLKIFKRWPRTQYIRIQNVGQQPLLAPVLRAQLLRRRRRRRHLHRLHHQQNLHMHLHLQRQVTFQRTTAGGLAGVRASGAIMNAVSETTAQRSLFFFFFCLYFQSQGLYDSRLCTRTTKPTSLSRRQPPNYRHCFSADTTRRRKE